MPRKWVRGPDWLRQPHVKDGPPPSLWWYARPDRLRVIDAYIAKYERGRTVPQGFKEDLVRWLSDLSRIQNKKPWGKSRTFRYWDIPSYARAHEMEPATLMARLRKLEGIAIELFSDSVPSSRKKATLTTVDKQQIRQRYLKGEDAKKLAEEFRTTAGHIGLLCRKEKEARDTAREAAIDAVKPSPAQATTAPSPDDDLQEPF